MAYKDDLTRSSADEIFNAEDDIISELQEQKADLSVGEDVDPDIKADDENSVDEYTPQFSEVSELEPQQAAAVKTKKKKRLIYVPVIIAAVIVLGSLLGYFIFSTFIVPSEEGTWSVKGSDGLTYYYTLDNTPDGNIVTMSIGSIYYYGTYETSATEESNNIAVSMYAGEVTGEYTFEVSGYKIFNNAVLTLTNGEKTITLNQAKRPDIDDLLQAPEDFKEDEKLTGEWEFNFEEYGLKNKVTFNDDGTMTINQFDMVNYYCVYTVKDSKIKFSFYGDKVIDQELDYSFKDGQLIFMDLNWTKVTEASKDEA